MRILYIHGYPPYANKLPGHSEVSSPQAGWIIHLIHTRAYGGGGPEETTWQVSDPVSDLCYRKMLCFTMYVPTDLSQHYEIHYWTSAMTLDLINIVEWYKFDWLPNVVSSAQRVPLSFQSTHAS